MKKFLVLYFFFFAAISLIHSQGIQRLSEKINDNVSVFFENMHDTTYSIVRFTNSSSLSDIELQRFYQLIVTQMEKSGEGIFKDLLTGFNNNKGNFDLSRINEITHIINIKVINNMGNLGVGIIIYNRNNNRIERIKYFEEPLIKPEVEFLGIKNPGLSSIEYHKELDIRVNNNLLNLSAINLDGSQYIFILLKNKIDIYFLNRNSMVKKNSQEIEWGLPYYPSIKNEGNLFLFKNDNKVYLSAGSNFSKFSYIYEFKNSRLVKILKLNFSVVDIFDINGIKYLAGFNFSFGKNFYKGKLYLKQFNDNIQQGETFAKDLPDFYSSSFYKEDNEFKSLYLIDRNYKLRIFSGSINEVSVKDLKFGSAIAVWDNYYAISGHTFNNDNLKIFKVGDNIGDPIFNKDITGAIKVLKSGMINGKRGLWVLVEEEGKGLPKSRVQFWRKNID